MLGDRPGLTDCTCRWKVSVSATAMHTARSLALGETRPGDRLVRALDGPASRLAEEMHLAGIPEEPLWEELVPLSVGIEGNLALAERALTRVLGNSARVGAWAGALASRIGECEMAALGEVPDLVDALAARAEPYFEEWSVRQQSLLSEIARMTEPEVVPLSVEVVPVWPVSGRGGRAFLKPNQVFLEMPGDDAPPEACGPLPVTVFLSWTVAQLNQDVPMFSEAVSSERIDVIAATAMLMPALCAAEPLELVRCEPQLVERALRTCRPTSQLPEGAAGTVQDWWETYAAARPPWNVALGALDRMLFEAPETAEV